MNGNDNDEWTGPARGGRPRLPADQRMMPPLKTRFRPGELELIGEALAILGERYGPWSRRTLVDSARRTILRDRRDRP